MPGRGRLISQLAVAVVLAVTAFAAPAFGSPLSPATLTKLSHGQAVLVIVEIDGSAADRGAQSERVRRHLAKDDAAVLALRTQGYASVKGSVESAAAASDAARVLDYSHMPLFVWRVRSVAAVERLQSLPQVRMVHENIILRPVSVSDLPFINQPQTAAQGAIGAGTTIAVIDGGLGNNYLSFADFGTCTGVDTPANTCRVVIDVDFYPGASSETVHGTNVSAIALGVAPGAKLAMYDVINGSSATSTDILTAMNSAISSQQAQNIVAISMSLGDSSSNSSPCTSSVFESAVTAASNAGIISVAAAGNNGSKAGLADPACAPGVVSVGAVYDNSYGTISWPAAADSGGVCTDSSAPGLVTCFSQSANYLTLLAPGTFVNAPSSAFQQTGTSQATPHVSGSIAVLRARYPAESLSATVQRLQVSGVQDTDPANSLTFPRLNLLAATNQGTALTLSGSGPSTVTAGTSSTYSLTATNSGPLVATNVAVIDTLPAGAVFVSASPGCTNASGVVTCSATSLGVNSSATFNITVSWTASGPVFDSALARADQIDSAPGSQRNVNLGAAPSSNGDAPLPCWAYAGLALGLFATLAGRRSRGRAT
jgi:uncharacterized repeat protein (TIGR01451 family)